MHKCALVIFLSFGSLANAQTLADALEQYTIAYPEVKLAKIIKKDSLLPVFAQWNDRFESPNIRQGLTFNVYKAVVQELSLKEATEAFAEGTTSKFKNLVVNLPNTILDGEQLLELAEGMFKRGPEWSTLVTNFLQERSPIMRTSTLAGIIGGWASARVFEEATVRRVIDLADKIPLKAVNDDPYLTRIYDSLRHDLVFRMALGSRNETSGQSGMAVRNIVRTLTSGQPALHEIALKGLGASRREDALPALTYVVKNSEGREEKLGALVGLVNFSMYDEALDAARSAALESGTDGEMAGLAIRIIENHFYQTQRHNYRRSGHAAEIIKELAAQENRPDLQYLALAAAAPIEEPWVADLFLMALRSKNTFDRINAATKSTWSATLVMDHSIDDELDQIARNNTTEYSERVVAMAALDERTRLKPTCEHLLE